MEEIKIKDKNASMLIFMPGNPTILKSTMSPKAIAVPVCRFKISFRSTVRDQHAVCSLHGLSVGPLPYRPRPFLRANRVLVTA